MRHFFGHVAGESYRNADGSDRQAIITECRIGEALQLQHEPDNPHDINAIRVLRVSGGQVGYLPRTLAGEVVSRSAKGVEYYAFVAGVGRAHGTGPYGMALLIVVDDGGGASSAAVAAHVRRTLADRLGEPTAQPSRPEEEPSTTGGLFSAVLVGLVVGALIILALILGR